LRARSVNVSAAPPGGAPNAPAMSVKDAMAGGARAVGGAAEVRRRAC
jgi:hypothetical protein